LIATEPEVVIKILQPVTPVSITLRLLRVCVVAARSATATLIVPTNADTPVVKLTECKLIGIIPPASAPIEKVLPFEDRNDKIGVTCEVGAVSLNTSINLFSGGPITVWEFTVFVLALP